MKNNFKSFYFALGAILLIAMGCFIISMVVSDKNEEQKSITDENISISQEQETNNQKEEVISKEEVVSKEDDTSKEDVIPKEDSELKATIAKISDTKVDFKNSKKQIFCGKEYDLRYKELDLYVYSKGERRIKYTDSEQTVFSYELSTGELRSFFSPSMIKSDIVSKISLQDAEKIANAYYESNGFKGYILSEKGNLTSGYSFIYSKYYGAYKTTDSICMWVNFEGEIYNLIISGDDFSALKTEINEQEILNQLDSTIKSEGYLGEYEIKEKMIGYNLDKGKENQIVMRFSVSKSNGNYSTNTLYMISLE